MTESSLLQQGLSNFTGTEQWYQHWASKTILYTDGVKYFADQAGAYWFLDILATEVEEIIQKQGEHFISATLLSKDNWAKISVTDGNDNTLLLRDIEYTDCPPGEWKFYMIFDGDNTVILLPSEY